jgi:hypothetical protein
MGQSSNSYAADRDVERRDVGSHNKQEVEDRYGPLTWICDQFRSGKDEMRRKNIIIMN